MNLHRKLALNRDNALFGYLFAQGRSESAFLDVLRLMMRSGCNAVVETLLAVVVVLEARVLGILATRP